MVGASSDRPNVIGDWRVSNPGPNRWFNPCTIVLSRNSSGQIVETRRNCQAGDTPAWQIPLPSSATDVGTFGNAGRNILRGPGLHNFDFGISRVFKITERQQLQFRAEVFNVANHPNFFLPNATASSSAFSTISRAANTGAGAQCQIQFGLKYLF